MSRKQIVFVYEKRRDCIVSELEKNNFAASRDTNVIRELCFLVQKVLSLLTKSLPFFWLSRGKWRQLQNLAEQKTKLQRTLTGGRNCIQYTKAIVMRLSSNSKCKTTLRDKNIKQERFEMF